MAATKGAGAAVRRISAVQEVGGELIVNTEYAPLTDAVQNGTLGWDYTLDFSPEKLESVSMAGYTFKPTAEDTIAFNKMAPLPMASRSS